MVYRIRTPRVVHETVDDEVIAIDFETGTYYSMTGSGALVWACLERGASARAIVAALAASFDGDRHYMQSSVDRFIQELQQAALVVEDEGGDDTADPSRPDVSAKRPFSPPLLSRFTDMQQLLLLDPIHEVDEETASNAPERE